MTRVRAGIALSLGLWFASACGTPVIAGPNQTSVTNLVLNTTAAVIAAGVQRARGGCYAVCVDGTVCNPDNGLCEKRTCAKGCGASQFCNRSGDTPMCEERASPDLPPTR